MNIKSMTRGGIRKIDEREGTNGLTVSLPGAKGIWKVQGAWLWLVGVTLIVIAVVWPICWTIVSKISIENGGTYVRVNHITTSGHRMSMGTNEFYRRVQP
jgi:hypothetical protein